MNTGAWIPIEVRRPERRTQILRIAPELFVRIIKPNGEALLRQRGIPEDAVVLGLRWNLMGNTIDFLVYSDTFPIVPEAECSPELIVVYESLKIPE